MRRIFFAEHSNDKEIEELTEYCQETGAKQLEEKRNQERIDRMLKQLRRPKKTPEQERIDRMLEALEKKKKESKEREKEAKKQVKQSKEKDKQDKEQAKMQAKASIHKVDTKKYRDFLNS